MQLPLFPTTTIGSFPQTSEVREVRSALTPSKRISDSRTMIGSCKRRPKLPLEWQEEIGLDVLVHGEYERNDMVQYFGEQLDGFAFTHNGWVQSYGSRCVDRR